MERETPWELLFSPKQWAAGHPNLSLQDYRLSPNELRAYSEQISNLRAQVRNHAGQFESFDPVVFGTAAEEVSNFARKMTHWSKIQRLAREPVLMSDYARECPP